MLSRNPPHKSLITSPTLLKSLSGDVEVTGTVRCCVAIRAKRGNSSTCCFHHIRESVTVAKWHVRVSKQSCKQANRLILWGVRSTTNKKKLFIFDLFCSKKLEKYDSIRHKVSKIHSHLDLKSLSFFTDSTNVLLPTP